MPVNWPGSGYDSLPRPGAATLRNAPGFALHDVIGDHATLLEAIEHVLGVTVAGSPGAGLGMLGNAAGGAVWDRVVRRNLLLNGDNRVWQRGLTAPTVADNAYAQDRWRCLTETTSTGFTVGREIADLPAGGSRVAAKLSIGASNNTKNGQFTVLEGFDTYPARGQAVSLQLKLKASDARVGDVRMAVVQWTGTEDAVAADPVSAWNAAGTNPTLIAGWAYANTPVNLNPTTAWATYRVENVAVSASATNLGVMWWIDDKTTNAGDSLLVTDVQLELGAVCTSIARLPFAQELAACQRYYFKTFPYLIQPVSNSLVLTGALEYISTLGTGAVQGTQLRFPAMMRTTPTVTFYNIGAAGTNWRNLSLGATSGTSSAPRVDQSAVVALNVQTGSDAAQHEMAVHLTAEAEL
jgi:hypothetical protein